MWYVIESKVETEEPKYPLGMHDVYELSLKEGKWETIGSYSSLKRAQSLCDSQQPYTWVEDGKLKARMYMIADSENPKEANIWSWDAVGE